MRVVLMGPPGAGKGTQAARLVDMYGMTHLSSGDIFRAEKASGSELGEKLNEYMSKGALVPDEIVVEMMAKAIAAVDGSLLLDGFPRTVAQAEALDETLATLERPLDAVVLIQCGDNVIVERIVNRRSCPQCGKGFNLVTMPSAKGENCEDCDVALSQREDDTEETVRQRLEAYRAQTEPVLDYYRNKGQASMLDINGEKPIDEGVADLAKALNALEA